MKKRLKRIGFLLSVLFGIVLMGAQSLVYAAGDDTYKNIDTYLEQSVKRLHLPAMSVILVDKDQVLFSNTYGMCDSIETPYIIGSVSKSFTALCVMQLAEEGMISTEDKLSDYLPEITDSDQVTIKQLLIQTSGYDTYQTIDTVRKIQKEEKHIYANVNYGILGRVIEKVSGQSYEEYIKQHVFRPLNMIHSSANEQTNLKNGLIQGYRNDFGFRVATKVNYPKGNAWEQTSAGYLCSSAADMGKYLQMYLNDGVGLVKKSTIDAMFYDNVYVDSDEPYSYGMGWTVSKKDGETIFEHNGLVENYMSDMILLPEKGIGIMLLVNMNDYLVTDTRMDSVSDSMILLLNGKQPIQISKTEYVMKHFLIDVIGVIMILLTILPLLRLKKYITSYQQGKKIGTILSFILLNLIYPTMIVAVPYLIQTPLWVIRGYARDVWYVLVGCAALAYFVGVIRIILFLKVVQTPCRS